MKRTLIMFCLLGNAALLQPGYAFEWDEDMRDQPSIKAQETQVYTNSGSVPRSGKEPVAPHASVSELGQLREQAGALKNPVSNTDASLKQGRAVYDIHCAACHGTQGRGDGKVGKKYVPRPMDLTIAYVQDQADGQLFYTISNGSVVMPYYRDVIAVTERWHLVNYIKSVLGNESE